MRVFGLIVLWFNSTWLNFSNAKSKYNYDYFIKYALIYTASISTPK